MRSTEDKKKFHDRLQLQNKRKNKVLSTMHERLRERHVNERLKENKKYIIYISKYIPTFLCRHEEAMRRKHDKIQNLKTEIAAKKKENTFGADRFSGVIPTHF